MSERLWLFLNFDSSSSFFCLYLVLHRTKTNDSCFSFFFMYIYLVFCSHSFVCICVIYSFICCREEKKEKEISLFLLCVIFKTKKKKDGNKDIIFKYYQLSILFSFITYERFAWLGKRHAKKHHHTRLSWIKSVMNEGKERTRERERE